jgi:tRNA-modifying protein YgfZ
MNQTPAVCALEDLGVLSVRGPDARKFLQGQLSNDITRLSPTVLLRAGLHTPQGRTLAVLGLLAAGVEATGEEQLLAVLPRELLELVSTTLRRYVLRAKVAISDASDAWRLYGLDTSGADTLTPERPTPDTGARSGLEVQYEGARRLRLQASAAAAPGGPTLPRAAWRLRDLAAGLPQLYLPTAGQFVAQMLNLDCIGAISFSKGCYTGQEVIARAHYRGRVKRRMQRFFSPAPLQLAAGDAARLADGRSVRIIEAQARAEGGVEFLAVTALAADGVSAEAAGTEAGTDIEAAPPAGASAAAAPSRAALALPPEVQPLPLPYELPP